MGMLLVREERFEGEGAVVCGDAQVAACEGETRADRKSTRLNSSHLARSRMPSSA